MNSWSDTQVVATVPVSALSGVVYVVTQAGAQSNTVSLTVAVPNITSISPTTVLPGGQVTITGTNFGSAQGSVPMGNYSNWWTCTVNSWSDTQVVATVPVSALSGVVYVVTQAGAQSNLVSLTVAAPTLPASVPRRCRRGGR